LEAQDADSLNNGKETRGDGVKNWGMFAQLSGNQATQKLPVTDMPSILRFFSYPLR
jgi:hypothetical protein